MAPPKRIESESDPHGLFIGQGVHLRGEGKWWEGGVYQARIVDLRAADDSVKVAYPEGGYKRFPREKFAGLLVSDESSQYGTTAAEWYHENFAPDEHDAATVSKQEKEIDEVKAKLTEAIKGGEFEKAHKLKSGLQDAQRKFTEEADLRSSLLVALRREDFLVAHELKQKLSKVTGRTETTKEQAPMSEILAKAGQRALGGGIAGAGAMIIQVSSLMWMRTAMNYQYRHGHSTTEAFRILYSQGGIPRFYRGIVPALFQGPLSRFGDTAANAGVLAVLNSRSETQHLPVAMKTLFASWAAASWRIVLTPIDTVKTTMQVEGREGLGLLRSKIATNSPFVLWHGALGNATATFAGHYPWFATYNQLDATLPVPTEMLPRLARNASIGFCASAVSDSVSNSLRVVKTYRQTSREPVSYVQAGRAIIDADGWQGLFGRGLKTRIMANGAQGMMFSVMWKYFQDLWNQ